MSQMKPINQFCPWSGDPVKEDSTTIYNGQRVGFCNIGCKDKFEKAISYFDALQKGQNEETIIAKRTVKSQS